MEADELEVVLTRASDLHSKIIDAIERSVKTASVYNSGGRSPNAVLDHASISADHSTTGTPTASPGPGDASLRFKPYHDHLYDPLAADTPETKPWQGASAEARSLSAIRDALEVLEEQLEQLHSLQQQQRVERDAALAELEESRRVLLRRLRDHHGREWEVVHEALAFAGEPVAEKPVAGPTPVISKMPPASPAYSNQQRSIATPASGHIEDKAVSEDQEASIIQKTAPQREVSAKAGGEKGPSRATGLGGFVKAVLAAGAVIALAVAGNEGWKWDQRRRMRVTPPAKSTIVQTLSKDKAKGKPSSVVTGVDGVPRVTVRERTVERTPEPAKQRSSPDVLFGRG